jgi:hypothetical protein
MTHLSGFCLRYAAALFLVIAFAYLPPANAQSPQKIYGCTAAQIQSAKADACLKKTSDDIIANYKNVHVLRCQGNRVECCIRVNNESWGGCESALVAPRGTKGIADRTPKTPDVVCTALKATNGVWAADPKSIKASSDKKSCSQTFKCTAPASGALSADERKCTPVVTVSNKQVTQSGTCVPGDRPGTCSSCLAKPPNEACTIAFRK